MVLGESLTDRKGNEHAMCNLLPVKTSFAKPKLTLGYRSVQLRTSCVLGEAGAGYRAVAPTLNSSRPSSRTWK